MLLTAYLIFASLVFTFLTFIWKNSNMLNLFLRLAFFGGMAGGWIAVAMRFGLVIAS
jgi:hypothetical protein